MKNKILEHNLELLRHCNPKSIWLLSQSKPHVIKESKEKIKKWFSEQSLKGLDVLIVYGVGAGGIYEAAKPWLEGNKNRCLAIIEDNLSIVRSLLETDMGTKLLSDPQVDFHLFREMIDEQELIADMSWDFLFKKFEVVVHPHYAKERMERFDKLRFDIIDKFLSKNAVIDEYRNYSVAFFRNVYPNLFLLPGAHLGNHLFGKFKNVPAIICGAGASLNKNAPILRELHKNAIIFAGGSALNVLQEYHVEPHLAAGIDPNPLQFDRLNALKDFKMPFLYRNRLFHTALKTAKGPRMYITGSSGYDIANWFEEKLDIKGEEIEEGHNVVNFCIEVANAMGCNPIILVGVDLAFTQLEYYAKGVIDNPKVTTKEILKGKDRDAIAVEAKDIYGEKTYTLWKWIAESEWISDYAKEHREVKFFNCTEGGLGFADVPNIPLKDVADIYLKKSFSIKKRISNVVEKSSLKQVSKKKVVKVLKELKESLERCIQYCKGLLHESENVRRKIKKREAVPDSLQTGVSVLYETELTEEEGFKAVLDIFNAVFVKSCQREVRQLMNPGSGLSENQIKLKKLEMSEHRFNYLIEGAKANIQVIDMTLSGELQKLLEGK